MQRTAYSLVCLVLISCGGEPSAAPSSASAAKTIAPSGTAASASTPSFSTLPTATPVEPAFAESALKEWASSKIVKVPTKAYVLVLRWTKGPKPAAAGAFEKLGS